MNWPWWTWAIQYGDDLDSYYKARAALFAHNRRLAAEREGWPDERLVLCESLEAAHPGWAVTWLPPNPMPGRSRPARWAAMIPEQTAYMVSGFGWRRPWVYGDTAAQLVERIVAMDGEIEAAERMRDAQWMRRPLV